MKCKCQCKCHSVIQMNKRLSFLTFNKDEQGTSKGADTPGAPEMKAVVRSSNSQLLGCSTGPGAAINSLKQVRGLAMGNREDHDMRYNGLVNSPSSLRFLLHLGVALHLLIMVSPIAKVTSLKSSVGIFTHQGHIS